MLTLQELDERVSIRDQLKDESDKPVVLVNVFHVAPEQTDTLIAAWADDARYFKTHPGFISTQLHRGIRGSGTYLNYAVWENVGSFRAAFANPIFQSKLQHYPVRPAGRICFARWLSRGCVSPNVLNTVQIHGR
jgi:heme-degrading monooxygenase HmoA